MTCAYIHLGVYEHVVKDGKYQDFKEKSCILVREQVQKTWYMTKLSANVMEATKELVRESLESSSKDFQF